MYILYAYLRIDSTGTYIGGAADDELEYIGVYYDEILSGRFVPRNIFFDIDMTEIESIMREKYGTLYNPMSVKISNHYTYKYFF